MTPGSEIDALFALPLAEFTAARNSLATRLKKEGRAVESEQVKALAKPPATAWAVNQLFWRQRKEVDRLLSLGEKVREAQTGTGADLRALLLQRRKMVSDLTDGAADILTDAGHAASPDTRRRIGITLDSLAAWGRANVETQAGRLTADLEPIGFDGLAALLDGRKLEPAKVLQFRRASREKKSAVDTAAARNEAAEAVKAAEKKLTAARREAQRAELALANARAHAQELEEQKEDIAARCNEAQAQTRSADDESKKATKAVAEAELALARTRAAIQ